MSERGFPLCGEERAGPLPERPGPTQNRAEAGPEPRLPSPEPVCRAQPCIRRFPRVCRPGLPFCTEQMLSSPWLEGLEGLEGLRPKTLCPAG